MERKMKKAIRVYTSMDFEEKYDYNGNDLGAIYDGERFTVRVWAPIAVKVEIVIYNDGNIEAEEEGKAYEMGQGKNGTWLIKLSDKFMGKFYTFRVYFKDGTMNEACDPYAKAVGVNGDRAMLIDLNDTNPEGWDEDRYPFIDKDILDAIIYEIHVRDFTIDPSINATYPGKYLSVCEENLTNSFGQTVGFDYIRKLGVTHLHLLPIADFGSVDDRDDSQYNWGYDPKNYNAPEGSYSTNPYDGRVVIKELKTMIHKLHARGISVIIDVVYNHTYNTDFCFNKIVPGYFYRFTDRGRYSNGSGCGNDVASERHMVRKFIADSVQYWAKEYHIDGFRFDLMGLIDVDTMNAVRQAVNEVRPNVIMYGEGWDMKTYLSKGNTMLAKQFNAKYLDRIAMFNDEFRNAIKGSVFIDDANGYISNNLKKEEDIIKGVKAAPSWAMTPKAVVNYSACHDNNTLFDKIEMGNKGITFEEKVRQNKLAALIQFTSQGVMFMHAGDELLRTKVDENGEFVSDSVRAGDSVNAIKWDDLGKKEYNDVSNYYKGLIMLKQLFRSFKMNEKDAIERNIEFLARGKYIEFQIDSYKCGDAVKNILVIYNPSKEDVEIFLPKGTWYVCCDADFAGPTGEYKVEKQVTVPHVSGMVLLRKR